MTCIEQEVIMKNILFVSILIFCSTFLYSQVNFELDFSFEKINPDDELINLQLFDYNDDGIEEIVVDFWNENLYEMRVVVYLDSGSMLDDFTKIIPYDHIHGKSRIFKSDGLENYVLITEHNAELPIMYLNVYNIAINELIESYNFEENNEYRFDGIKSILKTSIADTNYFFVGAFAGYWMTWESFHTYIYKFSFENNLINYAGKTQDCGIEQIKYGEDYIFTSGMHVEAGGMAWIYVNAEYYFKKISNEINSIIIDLYEYFGSFVYTSPMTFNNYPSNFVILSKNNNSDAIYVIHFLTTDTDDGVLTHFVAFNSDSCELIWSSTLSFIGNSTISSSSIISVNGEEHYIIYFRSSNFEIRDIINGNIIHHQISSISPLTIKRKSDGELLFFVEQEDEMGYDVYVLEGEIQVSADDNELPIANYELQNHPNPFNPTTTISFNLTTESTENIELVIYNLKGQKVKTFDVILSGDERKSNHVVWFGTDQNNNPVSSGIYFYQLKVGGEVKKTRKMLLLK